MKAFFSKLIAKFLAFSVKQKVLAITLAAVCCGGVATGVVVGVNNAKSPDKEIVQSSSGTSEEEHTTHVYNVEKKNDAYHWTECTCGKKTEKILHTYANGKCTCGGVEVKGTEGLVFELSEDENSYYMVGIEDKECTEIVIPAIYNNLPVTSIRSEFFGSVNLTKIKIPDSITSIRGVAFFWYDKLIEKENGLWYVDNWLISCEDTTVTTVTLREGTRGIAESAFVRCENLTEITIPDSVTSISDRAFVGRSSFSLTKVTFGKNSQLEYIGERAFFLCTGLTEISIPNGVTTIEDDAFSHCYSLTEIVIPDSVTSIGNSAFDYCVNLTSISVNENNANYQSIDGNLYSKDGTTLIQYTIGKTATEFAIPDGVATIEGGAFSNCDSLTEIVIPDSVTSIGNFAFGSCNNLTSISVNENNTNYQSIDGNLYSKDGTTLIQYAIGKKAIEFTIPNGVTTIKARAFEGCYHLIIVTIGSGVTSIEDSAFNYCHKLMTVINKSSLDIDKYEINVKEVIIDEADSQLKIIRQGDYIFYEDKISWSKGYYLLGYVGNETELVLPETVNGNVYAIDYHAFHNCSNLTNIVIPDSVTNIRTDIAIGSAFEGCDNLIEEENGVFYVDKWVIDVDKTVTNVTLREGTKGIASCAFDGCYSLTEVIIPNSVITIGGSAFSDCDSLTEITIPDSVITIGSSAFFWCDSLTNITFENVERWTVTRDYDVGTYTISSTDLADTEKAATYLTDTYRYYDWTRSDE